MDSRRRRAQRRRRRARRRRRREDDRRGRFGRDEEPFAEVRVDDGPVHVPARFRGTARAADAAWNRTRARITRHGRFHRAFFCRVRQAAPTASRGPRRFADGFADAVDALASDTCPTFDRRIERRHVVWTRRARTRAAARECQTGKRRRRRRRPSIARGRPSIARGRRSTSSFAPRRPPRLGSPISTRRVAPRDLSLTSPKERNLSTIRIVVFDLRAARASRFVPLATDRRLDPNPETRRRTSPRTPTRCRHRNGGLVRTGTQVRRVRASPPSRGRVVDGFPMFASRFQREGRIRSNGVPRAVILRARAPERPFPEAPVYHYRRSDAPWLPEGAVTRRYDGGVGMWRAPRERWGNPGTTRTGLEYDLARDRERARRDDRKGGTGRVSSRGERVVHVRRGTDAYWRGRTRFDAVRGSRFDPKTPRAPDGGVREVARGTRRGSRATSFGTDAK